MSQCTRVCRHSLEGEEGGDEVDGGGEAGIGFVIASGDAAELLEALEEVLDQMAPFVHLGVVRDGRGAIRLRGDNGGRPAVVQDGPQRVVVERLVGNEDFELHARDQRLDADAVVTLAGEQDKARQIA
jgi:hypothetical protein